MQSYIAIRFAISQSPFRLLSLKFLNFYINFLMEWYWNLQRGGGVDYPNKCGSCLLPICNCYNNCCQYLQAITSNIALASQFPKIFPSKGCTFNVHIRWLEMIRNLHVYRLFTCLNGANWNLWILVGFVQAMKKPYTLFHWCKEGKDSSISLTIALFSSELAKPDKFA